MMELLGRQSHHPNLVISFQVFCLGTDNLENLFHLTKENEDKNGYLELNDNGKMKR